MTDTPISTDDRKVLLTDKPGSYDPWEFRMRTDARSKKLLDMILGTDLEPTTGQNSKTWKAWKARQDAAAALLIKGLDDSQIVHVRGLENDPYAMWEKLRRTHEPVGISGAMGLWMEFFSMKYDGLVPMKTFLGRVTGVTERLKRFYGIDVSNDQAMARMITALPTEYSGLIRTLNDTLPSLMTLEYVEKKILVEDGTILAEKAKRGEVLPVDASAYGNTSALVANSNVTCENCGRGGHTKKKCWHKGGDLEGQYPDWWKGTRDEGSMVPKTNMAYDKMIVL